MIFIRTNFENITLSFGSKEQLKTISLVVFFQWPVTVYIIISFIRKR